MPKEDELAFAYKYPFSNEAKQMVSGMQIDPRNQTYLRLARARIEEALEKGSIGFNNELKLGQSDSVVSYVFSRLLVSALPESAIQKYTAAEARRSAAALTTDTDSNIARIAAELGVRLEHGGGFRMGVIEFLRNCPGLNEYALVNQRLSNGTVAFDKQGVSGVLQKPMLERIRQGLPIPKKEIPREIAAYAREVRVPAEKIAQRQGSNSLAWIDRLLSHPIPDVRKRVVYLVLAPYLVNIKGMDVEGAYKVIAEYIARCKAIDPTTRITDQQIMYLCRYAKAKGLKPLSLPKAKELLSPVLEL